MPSRTKKKKKNQGEKQDGNLSNYTEKKKPGEKGKREKGVH